MTTTTTDPNRSPASDPVATTGSVSAWCCSPVRCSSCSAPASCTGRSPSWPRTCSSRSPACRRCRHRRAGGAPPAGPVRAAAAGHLLAGAVLPRPLFTLLRTSLSTLPSRFAVEAEFDWNFGNYADALTDFGAQFRHGFVYAGAATVLCIAIGYPLAYVIAFRGGRWKNLLLGLVVVPFFTSYLIRTIAWQSLLADSGPVVDCSTGCISLLDTLGIMDNGRLLDTRAAVIGGLTYNFLPFMVLPIYVSLEKIDPAWSTPPRTSTRRRRGRSARSSCRCRSRACSPGRC